MGKNTRDVITRILISFSMRNYLLSVRYVLILKNSYLTRMRTLLKIKNKKLLKGKIIFLQDKILKFIILHKKIREENIIKIYNKQQDQKKKQLSDNWIEQKQLISNGHCIGKNGKYKIRAIWQLPSFYNFYKKPALISTIWLELSK